MNIIIVGSGKIGFALAQELSRQSHSINVIDLREDVLDSSSNLLDVNCINGSGISMDVLREAGAETADMIIAVTGNDELNVMICVVARSLGTKNTVARIRNPEYTGELELFKKGLGINRIINPELEAAVEISRLFMLPVANKVDTFANERVEIAEYTVEETDLLVGQPLDKMNLPGNILICGVARGEDFIIPDGSFVCKTNDILYMSGTLIGLNGFFKTIGHTSHKAKDIMIIGGSRTAVYLSRLARKMGINVRLIERDPERSLRLTRMLDDCLIICGDGTEEEVLLSEDLKKMDAFIALTDRDEDNMLSAFYAKKQGVPKVIPKINRHSYLDLVEELGIESVVCPSQVICDHMFRYVQALDNTKSAAMQKLYRIAEDKADAMEFIAERDSRTLGTPLQKLPLKPNVLVVAIVHGRDVIIPTGKTTIRAGDQVLVFTKKVPLRDLDDILL